MARLGPGTNPWSAGTSLPALIECHAQDEHMLFHPQLTWLPGVIEMCLASFLIIAFEMSEQQSIACNETATGDLTPFLASTLPRCMMDCTCTATALLKSQCVCSFVDWLKFSKSCRQGAIAGYHRCVPHWCARCEISCCTDCCLSMPEHGQPLLLSPSQLGQCCCDPSCLDMALAHRERIHSDRTSDLPRC